MSESDLQLKKFQKELSTGTVSLVLLVPPSLPVKNVKELIEYAKSNPN